MCASGVVEDMIKLHKVFIFKSLILVFIFLFFKGLLVPICVHVSGICFLNHKTSFYKHLAVAQCHFYRRKLRVCCRVLAASPPGGECLGDHLFEMEKPKHFARGPGSLGLKLSLL